jgi:hypothetical protein
VVAVPGTLLICVEEASSSLLSMLSLPDGESWFSPRILFSRAGVRPYLWRRSQTFPREARTRCSPASRPLPSSGEANGRTPQLTPWYLSDNHKLPRWLSSPNQLLSGDDHCSRRRRAMPASFPALANDQARSKSRSTCRCRFCGSAARGLCRLAGELGKSA